MIRSTLKRAASRDARTCPPSVRPSCPGSRCVKRSAAGREGPIVRSSACNADGHFADLRRAAEADVVVVAHNFIFEELPKEVRHDVGWV